MDAVLDIHVIERPRTYHGRSLLPLGDLKAELAMVLRNDFTLLPYEHANRGQHNDFALKCLPSDAERVRHLKGVWDYFFCHRAA